MYLTPAIASSSFLLMSIDTEAEWHHY